MAEKTECPTCGGSGKVEKKRYFYNAYLKSEFSILQVVDMANEEERGELLQIFEYEQSWICLFKSY
jgi:hypothetical protein